MCSVPVELSTAGSNEEDTVPLLATVAAGGVRLFAMITFFFFFFFFNDHVANLYGQIVVLGQILWAPGQIQLYFLEKKCIVHVLVINSIITKPFCHNYSEKGLALLA